MAATSAIALAAPRKAGYHSNQEAVESRDGQANAPAPREPMRRRPTPREITRRLLKAPPSEERDRAMRRVIRSIPRGKVATYAQVAAAAGYPLYHRQVVQLLRKSGDSLPWQRVVGAGGAIRLKRDMEHEQRVRLQMEGVRFRGKRVAMEEHQHVFRTWELED